MRGQRLIKNVDQKFLQELNKDYGHLIFKDRIKKNLYTAGEISSRLLLVAGVLAGTVILAAIAPNIIGVIGKMAKRKEGRIYFDCDQKQFSRALKYLKNRQFVKVKHEEMSTTIKLTKKGRQRYNLFLLDNIKIPKPKKWDGRWRIVIFDIFEQLKIAREALREKLKNLGFYQLQKSVFVFPYPCEKEINFIKQIFGVGEQVCLIFADHFQGEEDVKKYFKI